MSLGTLTCECGFPVAGMQKGEDYITPIRILSTLFSCSVTSAWFDLSKIKRLSLFFAHWLSGLIIGICYVIEDMMVTVCWTGSNLEVFIKILKFVELAASNMLAITNLAICMNIALIVISHRSLARVKSVSSPGLIVGFSLISLGIAAATVPFWEQAVVLKTAFWFANSNEGEYTFVSVSMFHVEFLVGVCMFFMVVWLLMFRMKEIKECWMIHVRIRYYFGLTLLGTIANLAMGICGTINVSLDELDSRLFIWSWSLRYIHISLDTVVLCSVLRDRVIDERARGVYSSECPSSSMSSEQGTSGGAAVVAPSNKARGGSGGGGGGKPIAHAPMV
ncbi:unnamed protein product [Scytosiphon promiscuus]